MAFFGQEGGGLDAFGELEGLGGFSAAGEQGGEDGAGTWGPVLGVGEDGEEVLLLQGHAEPVGAEGAYEVCPCVVLLRTSGEAVGGDDFQRLASEQGEVIGTKGV